MGLNSSALMAEDVQHVLLSGTARGGASTTSLLVVRACSPCLRSEASVERVETSIAYAEMRQQCWRVSRVKGSCKECLSGAAACAGSGYRKWGLGVFLWVRIN